MILLTEAVEYLLSGPRKDDPDRYDTLKRRLLYAIKTGKITGVRNRFNKRWFVDVGEAIDYAGGLKHFDLC